MKHYPIENQVIHDCRKHLKKQRKWIKLLKEDGYVVYKKKRTI